MISGTSSSGISNSISLKKLKVSRVRCGCFPILIFISSNFCAFIGSSNISFLLFCIGSMVLNCVVLYVLVVLLRGVCRLLRLLYDLPPFVDKILLPILQSSSMFPQIFSAVFRSLILFQLLQSILL
ncbi:hypothetical protein C2G38_857093 [Gigaspora rosea]|uniref:Uncharacterized protein n=1 Tax=Gigaspora rosea TaxID=44941 RepID=A0A397U6G0_9GLOM|nr:hypothetical protein C2G38_857093 [Gigaspora rosea]